MRHALLIGLVMLSAAASASIAATRADAPIPANGQCDPAQANRDLAAAQGQLSQATQELDELARRRDRLPVQLEAATRAAAEAAAELPALREQYASASSSAAFARAAVRDADRARVAAAALAEGAAQRVTEAAVDAAERFYAEDTYRAAVGERESASAAADRIIAVIDGRLEADADYQQLLESYVAAVAGAERLRAERHPNDRALIEAERQVADWHNRLVQLRSRHVRPATAAADADVGAARRQLVELRRHFQQEILPFDAGYLAAQREAGDARQRVRLADAALANAAREADAAIGRAAALGSSVHNREQLASGAGVRAQLESELSRLDKQQRELESRIQSAGGAIQSARERLEKCKPPKSH